LAAATAEAEVTFRTELATARADAIADAVAEASKPPVGKVRSAGDAIASRRESPVLQTAGGFAERAQHVREAVRRTVARLDADADPAHVAGIERLCRDVVAARSEARAGTLLRALQDDVQRANRDAESKRLAKEELDGLEREVLGIPSPVAATALAAIADARREGTRPTPALRAMVTAAVATACAEEDQSYAVSVAASCFAALGYDVDQGFDTRVVSGRALHARNTRWPGYAVRVQTTATGSLGFHVVRGTDVAPNQVREREVEAEFCHHFEDLRLTAALRGVDFQMTREDPPGAYPMHAVELAPGAAPRSHRAEKRTSELEAP